MLNADILYNIRLKKLILDNFRPFGHFELNFHENLTVFIGENGSGKTTILDATAELLKIALQASIFQNDDNQTVLNSKDVKNGGVYTSLNYLVLEITYPKINTSDSEEGSFILDNQGNVEIVVETVQIGFSLHKVNGDIRLLGLENLHKFREIFNASFREGDNLPILIYYGCNALDAVLPNAIKRSNYIPIKQKIYKGGLTPTRFNFARFYKWFDRETKAVISGGSDRLLNITEEAILEVLNDKKTIYANLRMSYHRDEDILLIDKQVENTLLPVQVNQMSAGEKGLLSLVADIVRRLILANLSLENPLEGMGIVLIDEIDLHLHPKWQRNIIPKLKKLFPNIQFVITTHSLFVVQSIESKNRFILSNQQISNLNRPPGLSIEGILEDYFNSKEEFDDNTENLLDRFYEMKKNILLGEKTVKDADFIDLLMKLSEMSEDIKSIIARDLRQLLSDKL